MEVIDINDITRKVSLFFKKGFKTKFLLFVSVPLLASMLFLTDYFILPERQTSDVIAYRQVIKIPQSAGGTSVRTGKVSGYKYTTATKLKFSTSRTPITSSEVTLTTTPVFKTVKTVVASQKTIPLASGFSGLNQVLFILCNGVMVISVIYVFLSRTITENARLNLIYCNTFLLAIWVYALLLY
ncbi:hypothetical protein [Pseudozobellia thermophila]|uniref:Uncharacterized protein n=1 Tax=Pseudozobellia thermophila TaxID=192903 RepID=A0A1M6P067_9FLAO|nr:hypothetical protein [Pseudozobellia thermophila]SHK01308.1 hypothetical protein SAMN04488513_1179 [Pseudozobellia thermophila]